jgi:hypothetical protein
MRPFTTEAAEKIIGLLCYSRTEDIFIHRSGETNIGKHEGTFRLAVALRQRPPRLLLSDQYESNEFRTITVEDAIKKELLSPSWEDLTAKLFLNDQDILLMCLMSIEEPLCLRFIEVERIKSYRDMQTRRTAARKLIYMPRLEKKQAKKTAA